MDRVAWLKAALPVERPCMEIGPFDRSMMSRAATAVLGADRLDQAGLRERYALQAPENAATIPKIDFVIGADGLSAGIAARNLASFGAWHMIEHTPIRSDCSVRSTKCLPKAAKWPWQSLTCGDVSMHFAGRARMQTGSTRMSIIAPGLPRHVCSTHSATRSNSTRKSAGRTILVLATSS